MDKQLEKQYDKSTIKSMNRAEKWNKFISLWDGRIIKHYDSKIINGEIVQRSFNKKWPILSNGRMTEKGRIKPEVREALLIKPSKTARLKCLAPFPVGSAPQKFINQDPRFWHWLNDPETPQDIKQMVDPRNHERVAITGSWESQWMDVQRWMDPIENKLTYEDYLRAIKERGHKIELPELEAPTEEGIEFIPTNQKSQVGCISGKLFGNTHARADKYLKPLAREVWNKVKKSKCIDTSVWCLGGRERRQNLRKDAPLRSRPVIMPDGVLKIIGLNFSLPIFDALGKINLDNFENEIRTGQTEFHANCLKEDEAWERFINVLEADIKNHDGGTTERTLVVAFGMIRACFPDSEEIDNIFFYLMSGEVFKNFVIPGRFVFRVLKGLCTGSAFTAILVSLCNWLNWSATMVINGTYQEDLKLAVYGDDTKIGLPHDHAHNEEWWKSSFETLTGHILDPCKIKFSADPRIDERPTFLKSVFVNGLHCRRPVDALESISFSRKINRNDFNQYQNITNQSFIKSFHPGTWKLMMNYRQWMFKRWIKTDELNIKWNNHIEFDVKKEFKTRDEFSFGLTTINYLKPIVRGFEKVKPLPYIPQKKKAGNIRLIHLPEWYKKCINEAYVNTKPDRQYIKSKRKKGYKKDYMNRNYIINEEGYVSLGPIKEEEDSS